MLTDWRMPRAILSILIAFFVTSECLAGLQVVLEMDWPDDVAPGVIQRGIPQWFEQGFHLRPKGPIAQQPPFDMAHNKGVDEVWPHGHGAYLQPDGFLVVSAILGCSFAALAVDLAEYSVLQNISKDIGFRGFQADGTSSEVTFRLDGQIDSFGPLPDFETFFFPDTFRNIVRLETTTGGYSLDSLVVEVVPEPATLLLMCVGGLLLKRRS